MSDIKEIIKLKGEKEFFIAKFDNIEKVIVVEGGGTYKDHEYLIVFTAGGHRCGYVEIKSDHPFDKKEHYDHVDIDCHGGLTYMSRNHILKKLLLNHSNEAWIGFDCMHYNDSRDYEAYLKYFGEEYPLKHFFGLLSDLEDGETRDFNFVENECRSIIDQLIDKYH